MVESTVWGPNDWVNQEDWEGQFRGWNEVRSGIWFYTVNMILSAGKSFLNTHPSLPRSAPLR